MKKLIFSLIIALTLFNPLFGQGSTDITGKPTSYWLHGNPDKDNAWNWMKDVDGTVRGLRGTGKIWYVDSGVSAEGNGKTITSARDTLDEIFALISADGGANRGDIVYIMQGHIEQSSTEGAIWDADVAGVTIIGLGVGTDMPTFEFNNATTTTQIGADNIWLQNVWLKPATDTILIGLEVESGSDYFTMTNCIVGTASVSTQEFAVGVQVGTSTGAVIQYNLFDAGTAQASVSVRIEAATGIVIRGNTMRGDNSTANIYNLLMLSENITFDDNTLWNGVTGGLNTEPVWELLSGTIGISRRNYAATNLATMNLAFVGDGMLNFGNYYTESAGGARTAYALDEVASTGTQTTVTVSDGI